MRIGLFTDSYHPATNGVVLVVDGMQRDLEQLGHEVFIVAPAASLKWWQHPREHRVIRLASIRGLFFNDSSVSVFFPPKQLKRIAALHLDAIVIFTPTQIGLMGAYAALTLNIPLVSQYCTDLTEYVERYPQVMPAVIALYTTVPFALKMNAKDMMKLTKSVALTRLDAFSSWRSYTVERTLTLLHNRCQAIISVSPKVTSMLQGWGTESPIYTIPSGINVGAVDAQKVASLRQHYNLVDKKVLLYVGRVAKEKNVDLLLDTLPAVVRAHPETRLLIVGDFDYLAQLKASVQTMQLDEYVIFTGRVPFDERWNYFALGDIFCFPSLTDTQALVINEAALMSLPTVWCDPGLNDVLVNKTSGILARPTAASFGRAINYLFAHPLVAKKIGAAARVRARRCSSESQARKIEAVLRALT
jgi:glycosyltransferase involved in cell wall biosynthesis